MESVTDFIYEEMRVREEVFMEIFVEFLRKNHDLDPKSTMRAIKTLAKKRKLRIGEKVKMDGKEYTMLQFNGKR